VNLQGDNRFIETTTILIDASREVGVEINVEKLSTGLHYK
jgi:hypothetical protein